MTGVKINRRTRGGAVLLAALFDRRAVPGMVHSSDVELGNMQSDEATSDGVQQSAWRAPALDVRSAPGDYAAGDPPTRVAGHQRGGVWAPCGVPGRDVGVVVGVGVDDDRAPVGVQDISELEAVGRE